MPVYIYDHTGLLDQQPDTEWKAKGREVHAYNRKNPGSPRKLLVGPVFPPVGHVFDVDLGDIRPITVQEQINRGEITLPPGAQVVSGALGEFIVPQGHFLDANGCVRESPIEDRIAAGLMPFDPNLQKIENGQIKEKSQQELLNAGFLSYGDLRKKHTERLRSEVDAIFALSTTPNGYRLDNLARQKAALTMQYRQLPDTDPVKADLLQRKVIYTDVIVDEILNEIERVQSAYDQAKNALQSIANQNQPVSVFDSVKLEDYLAAP